MNGFDLSTAQGIYIGNNLASEVWLGQNKIWPTSSPYEREYLTFEALQPTSFSFSNNDLQYSLDDGTTWTTLTAGTNTPTLLTGDKILWKQTISSVINSIGTFSATGNFKVYGNIMSLLYNDSFIGQRDLTGKVGVFFNLFKNCTQLIDTQDLILPATTLANSCYYSMFEGCSSLTTAPTLPAMVLANNCYNNMFKDCISLTTAPTLPATTLANYCYSYMFYNCISLTTAPTSLPAMVLAPSCYYYMFGYCSSLTTAPELPAFLFESNCYSYMFYYCESLNYINCNIGSDSGLYDTATENWVYLVPINGHFVQNILADFWQRGDSGIPNNWTISYNA